MECDDEALSIEDVKDDTNDALVFGIEPANEWTICRQQFAMDMFNE